VSAVRWPRKLTRFLPALELQTTAEDAAMVAAVVQRLADARLLVTGEDQQVDVAHEALIRGWPRLRGWIEEDRTALRTHRRITEAAEEWQRLHHDAGALFRGALLTGAQEWRERHADDLNMLEQAFLDASVALKHQEEAQERQRLADEQAQLRALADEQTRRAEEQASAAKRLRGVVAVLCCVALAAVGAWLVARNQRQRANTALAKADQETQRANTALAKNYWTSAVKAQTEGDWLRAAHFFARSGVLTSDLPKVKNVILALHHHLHTFFLGFQLGHDAAMRGMMLSKDERFILSWGDEGTVQLWQASDGRAIAVMQHEGEGMVRGATFNRDESRILSWGNDGTIRLWNIHEDFDFPQDSLQLLVEVVTGSVMNDVGDINVLRPDEWTKRKKQYREIAEQHLLTCQHRDVNRNTAKVTLCR
jgi:hypothetical protein